MYLICGGSSVGKSTFIKSKRAKLFIPNIDELEVKMMYQIESKNEVDADIVHYNILRSAQKNLKKYNYEFEESFLNLFKNNDIKHVYILVTSLNTILKRISVRKYIEQDFGNNDKYDSMLWENVYLNINLAQVYSEFLNVVKTTGVPYTILDTTNEEYQIIESELELKKILERK